MLWKATSSIDIFYETQSFPEKQEVTSPSGGQLLVMHIFPLLHVFKNMQLSLIL